jgi:hypothetical protein
MTDNKMRNIFILTLVVISIFGYLDSQQIIPWQQGGSWDLYNTFVAGAIVNMWLVALGAIALVYYLMRKDKSESVGIFVSGLIMLYGGVQDVMFFVLSSNDMTAQMCWFTGAQTWVSRILGECCVTPTSLVINALVSIGVAWFVLRWLWRQKW